MKKANEFLLVGVIVIAISVVAYFNYSVWKECRETNSFFYCLQLMNK
jgi:hypothetical protein